MSKTYLVDSSQQQDVYAHLQEIAATYPDASRAGAKGKAQPDTLSTTDVVTFFQNDPENSGVSLKVDGAKKSSLIGDENILKRVYAALLERDVNRDGVIDAAFAGEDLTVNYDEKLSVYSETELQQRVAERYGNSVFAVNEHMNGPDENGGEGTGFIHKRIDNGDGTYTYHVITNGHVADDPESADADYTLESISDAVTVESAKFIGMDPMSDIAVLEFTSTLKLEECPLAPEGFVPEPGATVVGIGNALGDGVIPQSGKLLDNDTGQGSYSYRMAGDNYPFHIYKTNAPLKHGNSGSPVFNLDGQVLGVFHMLDDKDSSYTWLIPSDTVRSAYENIIEHRGTHGVVYADWGIDAIALTAQKKNAILPEDRSEGVQIANVFAGTPAASIGLKAGDIITAIGGDRECVRADDEDSMYRFWTKLLRSVPGKKLEVEIYRYKVGRMTLKIVPEERAYVPTGVYETTHGFNAVDLTVERRRKYGIAADVAGVWVAARSSGIVISGLYEGNIIKAVNGIAVSDVKSFESAFESAKAENEPVVLEVYRGAAEYNPAYGGVGATNIVVFNP